MVDDSGPETIETLNQCLKICLTLLSTQQDGDTVVPLRISVRTPRTSHFQTGVHDLAPV